MLAILASGALSYYVITDGRRDYPAHFLAGAAGTALVLVVQTGWLFRHEREAGLWGSALLPRVLLGTTLGCVGVGFVVELTLFAGAAPDVGDLAHQSIGACLVGMVLIYLPLRRRGERWLLGLASVVLALVAFRLVGVL